MASGNNRRCIVCSVAYKFCNSCVEFKHLEPWHNIFHDNNCREIYNAVSAYIGKEKTKEETKARLDKCDLSGKNNFKTAIINAIDDVYATEIIDTKEIVENIKVEKIADTEELMDTIVSETDVVLEKSDFNDTDELPKVVYKGKKKK